MIYADYNGSAPVLPSIREYLKVRLDSDLYANPSAIHSIGQKVTKGIEKCRSLIAESMGAYPDQVIFNSGASEGLSQIIFSVLEFTNKKTILTSPVEHAVLPAAFRHYTENRGFVLKKAPINTDGKVLITEFEKLLDDDIALVSIMAANNETGVIQPYEEIAKLCQKRNIPFLCDTTQFIGKADFHFEKSGVDFAVCSGHKLGALPGSGFLLAKDPTRLHSLVYGSAQEFGLRGGSQNYIGIETLAIAVKDFDEKKKYLPRQQDFRLRFEEKMKKAFKEVRVIGDGSSRLAGTTLIGFPGVHGQAIQIELESQDIFVTTSAACADNQPETSKVLRAMGVTEDLGRSVIRISLSASVGEEVYDKLADSLIAAYNKLIKIHSY